MTFTLRERLERALAWPLAVSVIYGHYRRKGSGRLEAFMLAKMRFHWWVWYGE